MQPLDLQLNGYKGVDFNADDLAGGDLRAACEAVRRDGGGRMLATIITDRLERMTARISRLAELHERGRPHVCLQRVVVPLHQVRSQRRSCVARARGRGRIDRSPGDDGELRVEPGRVRARKSVGGTRHAISVAGQR